MLCVLFSFHSCPQHTPAMHLPFLAALSLLVVSNALAQSTADPRFNPTTGQSTQVWRKAMPIDYTHIRAELDIPDVTVPVLTGVATLTGEVTGLPVSRIVLDASGPQPPEPIAATVNGMPVTWTVKDGKVTLALRAALEPRTPVAIVIRYNLSFEENKGEGLTFAVPDPSSEQEGDRTPVIHAQGQAELNSRWIPMFDSPSDRVTSEVIVTVDQGYEVLSNGQLMGKTAGTPGSALQPRTRWHWALNREHAPYLITLAIGKFSIMELGGSETARPGLSMPLYTPPGTEDAARAMYARTPEIMAFLENYFDEPYPWPQYAQAITRGFVWGGMENTGATLMTMRSLRGEPGDADDLIVHEMAHQWMGNLITCRHWDHLWLNEGWATFTESLWLEHTKGREAYRESIHDMIRRAARREPLTAPQTPAIVSKRYAHPDDTFEKADNPYSKGALVLHMLREELGHQTFDRAVRGYIDANRNRAVETYDFRFALEAATGLSLERFFEQWLLRPGFPRLTIEHAVDGPSRVATFTITQTQPIDRHNPAYALSIPVRITYADQSSQTVPVFTDSRQATQRIALRGEPVSIAYDPEITLLASFASRGVDMTTGASLPGDADESAATSPAPVSQPAGTH